MPGSAQYREGYLTSQDGLRLYYRDYGDPLAPGATVLCLGGLTRNSKDFDILATALSETRRVLCPDIRGRGRSQYDSNWRNYNPGTYLDDIRHLLVATNTHRVAVIGTSMGGLLATGLAVALPTAIAGVVLNDVGPDIKPAAIERILGYVGTDRPQSDWPGAVSHLKEVLPLLGLRSEEDWLRFAQNTFRKGTDDLLHHDWDAALVKPLLHPEEDLPDLWRLFHALRERPVALLRGENSDVLTAETFERMIASIPDIISHTIPGMGHAPTLDEPEARDAIGRILERC